MAETREARLEAIVRELEWSREVRGVGRVCPLCDSEATGESHTPDCPLFAALSAPTEPSGERRLVLVSKAGVRGGEPCLEGTGLQLRVLLEVAAAEAFDPHRLSAEYDIGVYEAAMVCELARVTQPTRRAERHSLALERIVAMANHDLGSGRAGIATVVEMRDAAGYALRAPSGEGRESSGYDGVFETLARVAFTFRAALGKRCLAEVNEANRKAGVPNNWPAQQGWEDLAPTSQSIVMGWAAEDAGMDPIAVRDFFNEHVYPRVEAIGSPPFPRPTGEQRGAEQTTTGEGS